MPLQILSEPPPEPAELVDTIRDAIRKALPEASVEVRAGGPGHFEIEVASAEFAGLPKVRQQQRVYAAIAHLMDGPTPPVHAVDRMVTRTP